MAVAGAGLQALVQQMQQVAQQAGGQQQAAPVQSDDISFAGELKNAIDRVDGMKKAAAAKTMAFERGDPGVELNDVMVDMQKASVSFQMGIQVRNRLMTAYKDIMNMQV
ncbi:flagellar hook-basal body complex protein FliE [Kushneria phosphatilytica]|uniref:Flagellar hook-basal body complex protein FliE n=1 Tax=Kushneria phosphatilytica TaxID=657387 RepID=A0A1S1NX53_9GAMM|nr:flagellar hook-basal body complex protein FliE [Kushneria phosphatilytica]OHV12007.1 flagellar hook-basal body complex protein FliE [Kushneria phosphatilytica]QEL11196.1 flagellar hook-basal body complex protein FliE [Kushneria phosphatilytica]